MAQEIGNGLKIEKRRELEKNSEKNGLKRDEKINIYVQIAGKYYSLRIDAAWVGETQSTRGESLPV